MLLKPGWLIALLLFWVILQLTISIGDAIVYNQNTFGTGYIATQDGNNTTQQAVNLGDGTSPIMKLLTFGQQIVTNPLSAIVNANWGDVVKNLWGVFSFQADFLTGTWQLVSIGFMCIYAGFGISIVYNFVGKGVSL